MRFGIVTFPGSNGDHDALMAVRMGLGQPAELVWHTETDLSSYDCLLIPGGFSYGDYLRAGAIARFAPVMEAVAREAEAGKPVLGICNGFQILTEAHLLPGALLRNASLEFVCDWVWVRVEQTRTPWTQRLVPGELLRLPIAHGEGRYYVDETTLKELERAGQIVFRYVTADGRVTADANPNGSIANIAGVCNGRGNVVGLMPHPERAFDRLVGGDDGLRILASVLDVGLTLARSRGVR
ncbi:MAG: phosphoribosylformylglycinamidine synthase subunit PurQ [Thermomicrobium sp.]|nr:phosphoribosylformylglycinamidine synthase subunit PurQ [Thermomicrobium sp.]MDW7981711.1 phosphoribosylformylglycinamidine synthase subunit PurQ [Thermomicrobium sp.]